MTTKLNHKDRKRKIILTAGGTGGHIYPALALADLWKAQDPQTEFLFIGNDDRMEATLIPERGYPFIGCLLYTSPSPRDI